MSENLQPENVTFESLYVPVDYDIDGRSDEVVHCHDGVGQFPLSEILNEEEGGLELPDKGKPFRYLSVPLSCFCKMEVETNVQLKKKYHYGCNTTPCSG